jgi:hypothetical protein
MSSAAGAAPAAPQASAATTWRSFQTGENLIFGQRVTKAGSMFRHPWIDNQAFCPCAGERKLPSQSP